MFIPFWNYAHIVLEPSGWAVVVRRNNGKTLILLCLNVVKLPTLKKIRCMVGLCKLFFGNICCGWVSCDATKPPELDSWRVWHVQWTLQGQNL